MREQAEETIETSSIQFVLICFEPTVLSHWDLYSVVASFLFYGRSVLLPILVARLSFWPFRLWHMTIPLLQVRSQIPVQRSFRLPLRPPLLHYPIHTMPCAAINVSLRKSSLLPFCGGEGSTGSNELSRSLSLNRPVIR
jgi:hypothetical protein